METLLFSPPEIPLTVSPPIIVLATCLNPNSAITNWTLANFFSCPNDDGNFICATNINVSWTVKFGRNLSSWVTYAPVFRINAWVAGYFVFIFINSLEIDFFEYY